MFFKNIRIRKLPAKPAGQAAVGSVAEASSGLRHLVGSGFPLINYHIHLKGDLTLEKALAHSRETGVFYGIAANCGLNFPITNDQGIDDYIKKLEGQPCFIGMQAEGREWPTLFSKEAIAKFDYVFTDAMTIVDHRGSRARLWMPDEVDIPDKQAFMELLVRTIEQILDNEPVDIYANPTYLPDVLDQGIRHALDARAGQAGDRRGGPQRRGDRDQQPAEAAQGRFHPPGEAGRHQVHASARTTSTPSSAARNMPCR